MTEQIVVLGDLLIDQVLQIEGFPVTPAQHQRVQSALMSAGGANNTLIAGARLGLNMQALGALGDDAPARWLLDTLQSEGIDCEHVLQVPGEETSLVYTLADRDGQHVFLGKQGTYGPPTLPAHWQAALQSARAVFFDGWNYRAAHPALFATAARIAYEAQVPLFFDPGPEYPYFDAGWLDSVLSCTHTLLVTEDELRGITNDMRSSLVTVSKALLERGPVVVFIKLGAAGCLICTAHETVQHSGFKVAVRDTSGAGDTVAAAMMYGYVNSMPLPALAAFANAAGAAAVMKFGAGLNVPTRAEIDVVSQQPNASGF